ncbi:hypothetical protein RRG08_008234 [Elysia crispata]|uniref:Uncharacterized protein n=1 Tax=Elysia crispata TaxID=231223 RepID=A0AAE1CVL2_9GAST|nr:hypothetical protein RRG08_008234 [Elysia crispata]
MHVLRQPRYMAPLINMTEVCPDGRIVIILLRSLDIHEIHYRPGRQEGRADTADRAVMGHRERSLDRPELEVLDVDEGLKHSAIRAPGSQGVRTGVTMHAGLSIKGERRAVTARGEQRGVNYEVGDGESQIVLGEGPTRIGGRQ